MKFKAAVIGILIAILSISTITAVLLVRESRKQTEIALEIAEETRKQTEIANNTKIETEKQTEIALKTADILSLKTDIETHKIMIDAKEDDYFIRESAAYRIIDIKNIRELLGLDKIIEYYPLNITNEEKEKAYEELKK